MEITFENERLIVVQKEIKKTTKTVNIIQIVDTFEKVECVITVDGQHPRILTLWEGQDYIDIGQYTDDDIKERVSNLV